jgi:hypothetical protein
MKVSHSGIIAVILLVIALAAAGCLQTGTPQSGGSRQAAPASGTAGAPGSGGSSGSQSSGSVPAGPMVSGSELFKGLSYSWVEYHTYSSSTSTGQMKASVYSYIRFSKNGTCTIRVINGPKQLPATECAGAGVSIDEIDPNVISSNEQSSCSTTGASMTVPAGTFTATQCTVTGKHVFTEWVVPGKFVIRKEWPVATDYVSGVVSGMELDAYG